MAQELHLAERASALLRDWTQLSRLYGPLAIPFYPLNLARLRLMEWTEGFDARFGTDTGKFAWPWNLPSMRDEDSTENHGYEGVPAWLVRDILLSLRLEPRTFTFIDMGSGKGRSLLVASELPFARLVGVELSEELHRIAQRNVERYRTATQQCRSVSLHCMSAADYEFGREPLVLFMYNPFGKQTIRQVLSRLEASLLETPREAYVIYVHPQFAEVAQEFPMLRVVESRSVWWRPWSRHTIYRASPPPPAHVRVTSRQGQSASLERAA